MNSARGTWLASISLWVLVALAAWPAYVAVNLGISFVIGEGSIVDLWGQEPKRNLIASFIDGYKSSAVIAVTIGFIAALDFLLLAGKRFTGYFSGISIPIACVAVAFIFHAEPIPFVTGLALTGIVLWILYKFIDILCRLRRTA